MKKSLVNQILVGSVIGFIGWFSVTGYLNMKIEVNKAPVPESTVTNSRRVAPLFTYRGVKDGTPFALRQYKGKVVVLNFWATWCGPCRLEVPGLIAIQKKYSKKGAVVIGLSLDDNKEIVMPFMQEFGINYPVALATKDVRDAYGGVFSIPTTFVIDKNGRIADMVQGYESHEYFEAIVDTLLSE